MPIRAGCWSLQQRMPLAQCNAGQLGCMYAYACVCQYAKPRITLLLSDLYGLHYCLVSRLSTSTCEVKAVW